MKIGIRVFQESLNSINQISQRKRQIIQYLSTKQIRLQRITSLFNSLNNKSRQFLTSQSYVNILSKLSLQKQFQQISLLYTKQFKLYIKQPDLFENEYNIEMNKNNVKLILWIKNGIRLSIRIIQLFLESIGVFNKGNNNNNNNKNNNNKNNKGNKNCEQFLQNQLKLQFSLGNQFKSKLTLGQQRMLQDIYRLIKYSQYMDKLRKINLINNLYQLLKRQSKLQIIQSDITKFIKLYNQFESNTNSYQLLFKFNTSSNFIFTKFNFNILLQAICLKDDKCNNNNIIIQQQQYEEQKYQNQFMYINDGDYYYNNCYRYNIFCQEQGVEIQRNTNLFIGREFLVIKNNNNNNNNTHTNNNTNTNNTNSSNSNSNSNNNNNTNNSNINNNNTNNNNNIQYSSANNISHVIQVSPYLPCCRKIFFRLRLNSQYYSFTSLGIRYSSSFQYFTQNIHNYYIDIKLKIIPDVNENSIMYKYVKDYIKGIKIYNKLYKFYDIFDGRQQEGYIVFEDDVVSVQWEDVNQKNSKIDQEQLQLQQQSQNYIIKKVSFINQTRQILLKTVQFKHQKSLFGQTYVNLPIFGAVALYNSIAEVQIFNQSL